jgi:tetratricopeptide (TPR) repeat protein
MAAPAGSAVLEEQAPVQKRRRALPLAGLAVALLGAALAAVWTLRSGPAASAADLHRQKLDAFYVSQREPLPPEACREKDAQILEKLVASLPNLAGDPSEEMLRVGRAANALGTLPQGSALSAEAAFLLARAQVMAGGDADQALERATACPNFAAAQCLAGKAALKAGRKEEAVRRLTAALAPGYARPRLFLALSRMDTQPDEAFRLLQEAVSLQPDFAEAHFALGRAHDAKGAVASREGNAALAEAERAQSRAAYCRAAELGFGPAKALCPPQ